MFYSSAPSSENQDRTTVPRTCSTVLLPLRRIKTGPQSPEHVLQFCPLFRESRQDHSPRSTFSGSALSSENQDRTTVPKHVLGFCPLFREASLDHSPQSTFCSSALSSEKQDRTTVPRARSISVPSEDLLKTTAFIQNLGLTI